MISPFKSISSVAKDSSCIEEYGTVHTFQGREADVVFLVLGGNNKKPVAKSWASQKANILNVALTRAKKRVYIVGNYEEWSKMEYFNFTSKNLSRVSIKELICTKLDSIRVSVIPFVGSSIFPAEPSVLKFTELLF